MILTDTLIAAERAAGNLTIEPYDPTRLGPNSYDVALDGRLLVYEVPGPFRRVWNWLRWGGGLVLDTARPTRARYVQIPPEGIVLRPGILYLGSTVERAGSAVYLTDIDGRSTFARQGLSVHVTAGRGDVGWDSHWTLELTCIHPIRIYAGDVLAQIYFSKVDGQVRNRYDKSGHRYGSADDGPVPALGPEWVRR